MEERRRGPRSLGRRSIVVAVLVMAAGSVVPSALADHHNPDGWPTYPLVFPVAGEHYYSDTWGAPRSGGRSHEGTDIMADKMVPVVAAASGTVGWMHDEQGGKCCAMEIEHDDGWQSWYIHLNNDTPGTDDGLGWGFAPGITRGVHVTAGQLIGWVGDSGDAEGTAPHVHFELHQPGGVKINPYPSLREAQDPSLGSQPPPPPPPEPGETEPMCIGPGDCDGVALVEADGRYHLLPSADAFEADQPFYYGNPGDVALMGDWDCDGERTPAMYRPSNGFMYLRNSNTSGVADVDYFYGDPSDIPIAGDFDGDGCDTLAIYRADEGRVYVKNSLGTGIADYAFFFGNPGDKPFVGDFDGDGIDTVGLHRESTGFVYFRNTNDAGPADFSFFYGDPGDKILAGDWDGDGDDTVAIYRPSTGRLYYRLSNTAGFADREQWMGDFAAALVATGGPPAPQAADPILAAAGDIADCESPGAEATALLLDDLFADGAEGVVAPLGDLAYPDGTAAQFADCYGPTWGRHLERTRPTPGNHEYGTPGAAPYFDYFGAVAGDPDAGYYSYDLGNWHVVVLNSNCAEVGGCEEGSPQHQWLQGDLAASQAQCTVAYMHAPRFSSGPHGGDEALTALWEELWADGVEVALGGHDHLYERFGPQDAYGAADAQGIRQFVAGTGGRSHYDAGPAAANSEVIVDDAYGVLVLTLSGDHYHWEFVAAGGDVLDSGEADCF